MRKFLSIIFVILVILFFTNSAYAEDALGIPGEKKCTNSETENPRPCILVQTSGAGSCCEGWYCIIDNTVPCLDPLGRMCGVCYQAEDIPAPARPGEMPSVTDACRGEGVPGCASDDDCCSTPPNLTCMVNKGANSLDDALNNSMCTSKTGDIYLPIADAEAYFNSLLSPAAPPPCAKKMDGKCVSVDTGLGIALGTDASSFIKSLFGIILGLSGGIALLLIIASGFKLIFSRGNPEKMQGVKESLTAAIVGLLFIIFSIVILEVIGVDILRIPGFST